MKIHHLRNATLLLTLGEHRLLVDPMLADPGTLPGFKIFGGDRRKNPLVPLPPDADACLEQATAVLITHEHPDHLDVAGLRWIQARQLPVWASTIDAPNLRRKGLEVHELRDGGMGMGVEIIPAKHGRGILAWLMGPVSGCYLAHPDEPSIYLTSDAVLTDDVLETLTRLKPDVVVAPAGSANFGAGSDILFSADELVTLVRRAPGKVVFNHLEAIDHCPTTRASLRQRMQEAGVSDRVLIPQDGEQIEIERQSTGPHARPKARPSKGPGFQKWLTAKFAGT